MKKIFLIIFIIIFTSNFILAQLSGGYTLYNLGDDKSIKCNVSLYKDGTYEITLDENTAEDIVESILISIGTYLYKNGEITLIDNYHGYKMIFIDQKCCILAKKSFQWMQNKKFIKTNSDFIKSIYFKIKFKPLKQERADFKKLYKEKFNLNYGVYENEVGFSINFLSDNKYKFEYRKIILSEGTFKKNENELVLFDTALNYPFYVFIKKNVLISKLLPEDYEGNTFKKK